MKNYKTEGDFTLPGEAGYEELTMRLAETWGADVIRDSDGTKLSDQIIGSKYRIYSTICMIRNHNRFIAEHPECQQQTFLSSEPVLAVSDTVEIDLLKGYSREQFAINDRCEAVEYFQVWDRTANALIPRDAWVYADGAITVSNCTPWHRYTASFLCWRIWEEINMYNHTTNHWESEHLRQLDPRHPLAWSYMKAWLEDWCINNPHTDVVRLTSLFYNFVWIFGDDDRRRSRFTDWASYDFTVSPAALNEFKNQYGYMLTAEDFVNKGLLQATHRPPTKAKLAYMDMIQRFVAEKAAELVNIIHKYHKSAYVFYDDSWVGMEPYGKYFRSVGFDGLIKCVFSGYECRLCAGADVPVHELRFHPYLFPVGLGGAPTFSAGGHPEKDALAYWMHVRRAIARQPVERIGLGGYLHLTEEFPEFVRTIEDLAGQFRQIKALHAQEAPETLDIRVAVLHTWGSLRPWTLSGHFHETDANTLIHINEALSGLPVHVKFISFEDILHGALADTDVLINAGLEGDAWSGGDAWTDPELLAEITRFVYEGGCFLGAGEPSAAEGFDTAFALAQILGVDRDKGRYACHSAWSFEVVHDAPVSCCLSAMKKTAGIRLVSPDAEVWHAEGDTPVLTYHRFGKGSGVYLGGFCYSPEGARMLLDILLYVTGKNPEKAGICTNPATECAWFCAQHTLVIMNNSFEEQETDISFGEGSVHVVLSPAETKILEIQENT